MHVSQVAGANPKVCFSSCPMVFGSERLTLHVHILEMSGESYRLKGSRWEAAAGVASPDRPAVG